MRKAFDKFNEIYGTQLGQDVLETLAGAGIAAGGQALFTDMTPEEIAMASALGIGAATVGRPLGGRAGQALGNHIHRNHPVMSGGAEDIVEAMVNHPRYGEGVKLKLAPYTDLNAPAKLGQVFGRGYGDNMVQGVVGLASPLLFAGENDA
jgi:hypothetical protein